MSVLILVQCKNCSSYFLEAAVNYGV